MAKIMATMAEKTPNEMFETAISSISSFFVATKKKPLSKNKKEREREEREREYWKNQNQNVKNGAECRGTWGWCLYLEHEYRVRPHFYRIQHAQWPPIFDAIFFIEIPCNSKLLCFIKERKEKVKQAVCPSVVDAFGIFNPIFVYQLPLERLYFSVNF